MLSGNVEDVPNTVYVEDEGYPWSLARQGLHADCTQGQTIFSAPMVTFKRKQNLPAAIGTHERTGAADTTRKRNYLLQLVASATGAADTTHARTYLLQLGASAPGAADTTRKNRSRHPQDL